MDEHGKCPEHRKCPEHNILIESISSKIESLVLGHDRLASGQEKMCKLLTEISISSETIKRIHERQDKIETLIIDNQNKMEGVLERKNHDIWNAIDEIKRAPWKIISALLVIAVVISGSLIIMYGKIEVLESKVTHSDIIKSSVVVKQ